MLDHLVIIVILTEFGNIVKRTIQHCAVFSSVSSGTDSFRPRFAIAEECILSGLYHGEFSLNHPDVFVDYIKRVLEY